MEPSLHASQMIEYIKSKILRDNSVEIRLDTPLVTSGLVDSFALLDVLMELEKVTARHIPASLVSPNDLNTVREMLDTAERLGEAAA